MRATANYRDFLDAGLAELGISKSNVEGVRTRPPPRERILVVETDAAFRNSLVQAFWETGYDVLTTTTAEQAFRLLRNWRHPIGGLYTRAALPGLIDGWILADQNRDNHPDRPAVIGMREARFSSRGDVVLNEPILATVMDAIHHITRSVRSQGPFGPAGATPQSLAA